MSSTQRKDADRIAGRAWQELLSAMGAAGGTARSLAGRTQGLADGAGDRVGGYADEARRRALAARDALAGRRAPLPWTLIAAAAMVGAMAGWAAAILRRQRDSGALLAVEPVADEFYSTSPEAAQAYDEEIAAADGATVTNLRSAP